MKKAMLFMVTLIALTFACSVVTSKAQATTYHQGVNKIVAVSKNKYSQTTRIYVSKDRANQIISSGLIYSGFAIPGVGAVGKLVLGLAGVWTRVPGGFYFTCTTYYPSVLTGGQVSAVYSKYHWQ